MNSKRNSKSTSFNSELSWIKAEKKYFKEIDRRQEMDEFRETIVRSIYPCYESVESAEVKQIEEEKSEAESTEFAFQSGEAVDL